MSIEGQSARTFELYSREQLEIYAGELQQHAQRERKLRQSLEQRVRELEALNRLFQRHLEERFQIVDAYRDLALGLQRLAAEVSGMAERAVSLPLPEREEVLGDTSLRVQTDP